MMDDTAPAPDDMDEADGVSGDPETSLDQVKAELAEWRDKAMRAIAEAENTRRRAERENNDARAYAIQKFAKDLFAAADSLERALKAAPRESTEAAVSNFVLGIEMTEKALQSAFERNSLKKIDPARNEKFDPHQHQAMMEQDDPTTDSGAVIMTMQPGYELFGRVVRPAMVVVAAKRAGAPAQAPEPTAANPYGQANGADAGGSVDTKA